MKETHWIDWIYHHPVFRYLVGGGTGAVVIFILLALMVEIFHFPPLVATTISFVIGSLVNYTLQYYWTFKADGPHRVMLTRYALVTLVTMSLNTGLFWAFTEVLGIHYIIAQALSIGLIIGVNFFINKHYTFASDEIEEPAQKQLD